ncbi:kinetochore protein NDC80 [Nematocida sp. AWRm77]|nr:kinetochore protein NDC80 [Nematocida sp. AWRm77]
MRRATMTGPPQKGLGSVPGRATLSEDPRKKQRNVREKAYQVECINTVLDFLGAKGYDKPISVEMLANLSTKEFQSIFRFVHGHIDASTDFSRKFEEEVVSFLRSIKYPYASEINKSQLTAITPHAWPVLLSMLAWVVSLIQTVEGLQVLRPEGSIEEESKKIFYHYLYNEYSAYMEGRDEEGAGERQIQHAMAEINKEKLKTARECEEYLEKIKKEISSVTDSTEEIHKLEEAHAMVDADLERLEGLKKNNEHNQKKYNESLAEAQAALNNILQETAEACRKKALLEEEIRLQPIKPEDVEEMTEERDVLLKSTEELKHAKTTLLKEIEVLNVQIKQLGEEAEKLVFDAKNIPSSLDINLKVSKRKTTAGLLESEECEVEGDLEREHARAKEHLQSLARDASATEAALLAAKEKHASLQEKQRALSEEISSKEERAKIHAQIYIEKKEATEEEYRRAVGRVDKAEAELLKILASGDNGLFQSEQNLERLRIRKNRIQSQITAEEAEVQRITALVAANTQALQERVQESYQSFSMHISQ